MVRAMHRPRADLKKKNKTEKKSNADEKKRKAPTGGKKLFRDHHFIPLINTNAAHLPFHVKRCDLATT